MTLPIVTENGTAFDCGAKLADLTRAVELNTEMLGKLTDAVNNLGVHSQVHTDQVNEILTQFKAFGASLSAMGPAGMLKMMMGKNKELKGTDNG